MKNKIFILQTKKSSKYVNKTYCIAIFKLGTDNTEFIIGETDNEREYKVGDETGYVYSADYVSNLDDAVKWIKEQK